jgi:hypothetical protein
MKRCALLLLLALLTVVFAQCGRPKIDYEPDVPSVFVWDPFLDTLQARTLQYFLDTAQPTTGLVPDRAPGNSPASIAAVGFGLTAYPIAVERNLVTREDAARRALGTLRFLAALPQNDHPDNTAGFKGLFYHFLTMREGTREWNCELSTIDTGLLMAGVLFAQSYFDQGNAVEDSLRELADSLYRRVDWQWAMSNLRGLIFGWTPEQGFSTTAWHGYNEAMIMYILALGSPTHPVPPSAWQFWTSTYVWGEYYGRTFVNFGPLFGHQYSHCWIDFRGIQDAYMRGRGSDYSENSRQATYTHRAYARENPRGWRDYSDSIWGFTACDGPKDTVFSVDGKTRHFLGYSARGVSMDWVNDDGTIAPTAAGGSVVFAPEICVPALKAMRQRYGSLIWRDYGFVDAFNPTFVTTATGPTGWFDHDYIGIDQGPIVIMIENLRNGFVWEVMKRNPYIIDGLKKAGFTGGWLNG